jgi:hypothetical protein
MCSIHTGVTVNTYERVWFTSSYSKLMSKFFIFSKNIRFVNFALASGCKQMLRPHKVKWWCLEWWLYIYRILMYNSWVSSEGSDVTINYKPRRKNFTENTRWILHFKAYFRHMCFNNYTRKYLQCDTQEYVCISDKTSGVRIYDKV